MKRFELTFAFIQLPLDYLMLILAGFSAYGLRFTKVVTAIRPILFNLAWNKYWPLVLVVATGWIVIFALTGLYSANPNRKLAGDFTKDTIGGINIVKTQENVHFGGEYTYFFKKGSLIYSATGPSEEFIKYIILNGKW